jgi:hypothetical protein
MLIVASSNYVDALYDDLARVERARGDFLIVGFPEGHNMLPPNVAKMGSGYQAGNHSKYVENLYNLYGQAFAEVAPSIRDPKVRGRFGHVMAGYHALMHYWKVVISTSSSNSMVGVRARLIEYVDKNSRVVDLQFDPTAQPSLPFDPYSEDSSERRKIAHYLLLVASVDEGNVVGEADNARKLLVALHSVLRERLFVADEGAFREALAGLKISFPTRESGLIPNILASVNSFSLERAGDLVNYSKQFANPAALAEEIAMNVLRMGRTVGSTRKKTWMYLRWMVRSRPDLRLFDHFHPKDLFVPVDRNVARVAACLGRIPETRLNSLTWDDTVEVTNLARDLYPNDPARVDYPFFLLGRRLRSSIGLSEKSLLSVIDGAVSAVTS